MFNLNRRDFILLVTVIGTMVIFFLVIVIFIMVRSLL